VIFSCTGCGKCCTGSPGLVFVTVEEIEKMAEKLDLSIQAFTRQFVRIVNGRFCLKELLPHYDCIFYKDRKCTVYDVRPEQCKTYPFWPRHMASESAWENVKKECEGINPYSTLKDVPICHS